jgi:hypothetical protein
VRRSQTGLLREWKGKSVVQLTNYESKWCLQSELIDIETCSCPVSGDYFHEIIARFSSMFTKDSSLPPAHN